MFALHDRQRKYAACDLVCQLFAAIVACELGQEPAIQGAAAAATVAYAVAPAGADSHM